MSAGKSAKPNRRELRYIEPGTPEYELARCVRYEALYEDLGLPVSLVEDTDGRVYRHLAVFEDGELVGYARLHLEDGACKVFQVSVVRAARGRGVARAMMSELVRLARESGRDRIVLDARAHVVGMYERLGFIVDGEEFISPRTGTLHFPMSMELR